MTDKFIVANERGMKSLPGVLRKHKKYVNVYSLSGTAEENCSFSLGWDRRPDSDWGRYMGTRLRVIVTKPEFVDQVENEIRKALGWEPLDESDD